jgi:transposase
MEYARVTKKFYCGIDMHAHTMYVCVMNKEGKVLVHHEIPTEMERLLQLLKPFGQSLAVCCESTFNWYWLSDGCRQNNIPFYLGHALYIKAIHRNKKKDDRIDARTLTELLRTGFFPLAYAYPQEMRETRDLLRRRHRFVQLRAALARHIKILLYQQGIQDFPEDIVTGRKTRLQLLEYKLPDAVSMSIQHDIALIDHLDKSLAQMEWRILKSAEHHDHHALALLQTVKGLGDVLSLTILYEIHKISRFPSAQKFSSYSRVVKVDRTSSGKKTGSKNQKIGNPYLRWAFGQLALNGQRFYPKLKEYTDRLKRKEGKKKAYALLSHKFAVAVYYMLKNKTAFNLEQFVAA